LNGWFEEWRGYAFDEPSGTWPEAKYRRSQIEFDADIKDNDNRQDSKYKRYKIFYSPLVLLERVLDLGAAPVLPPSLLGHESARGYQS
jgi:hypothetical protein